MIRLSRLNKLAQFIIFFSLIISNCAFSADDIWKKKEDTKEQNDQTDEETEITIESPILSGDVNKITVKISEQAINNNETVIGIFDPEENNFNLDMWSQSNGEDIKNILKKISKLQLSKFSENLLLKVLFTNSYPPKNNLTSKEFLKIKIDWLVKNNKFDDLEILLNNNPEVGYESGAIKSLINEYLSYADIKSACEKINFLDKSVQNDYLDKFSIYCLINKNRNEEAELLFDLLKERGFKDKFFENKFNFLVGLTEATNQKILDDNLLNFYLSHITSEKFEYEPNEKTDKHIWRYLSSANLIKISDFENEDIIFTYEKAAVDNSFEKDEIFKIYLTINFNFNQLVNATEIYKNLPNYKARALIYQSILLSDNAEKKIYLTFLLKDLFDKDKLFNVYSDELFNILNNIDSNEIPQNYEDVVKKYLNKNLDTKKIKFNNDILHKSKVLKHFLDNNEKLSRTEKDFKTVYKKMKKNKKYFISIKDIIVLESLAADGLSLPKDLDYGDLVSQLTVPQTLENLVNQQQVGLVMLKIIEIIGEDKISDLDSETIYFLNKILNKLNLKKIRNDILSEVLPLKA